MKTTARFLVASCLPLLLAACQASTPETSPKDSAPVASAKAAAGSDKVAAKAEAKAGEEGCIYAEGKKDNGEPECPHGPGDGGGASAAGEGHFGSPFTLAQAKPLTQAIEAGGDTTVLVEGEVEAVCQKKGCWMVIKDGTNQARVLMKDYGFSVPVDCRGKKATIEGTLASRTFSEKQVKHLAEDGGKNPEEVSGERTEHVLTASGIRIQS